MFGCSKWNFLDSTLQQTYHLFGTISYKIICMRLTIQYALCLCLFLILTIWWIKMNIYCWIRCIVIILPCAKIHFIPVMPPKLGFWPYITHFFGCENTGSLKFSQGTTHNRGRPLLPGVHGRQWRISSLTLSELINIPPPSCYVIVPVASHSLARCIGASRMRCRCELGGHYVRAVATASCFDEGRPWRWSARPACSTTLGGRPPTVLTAHRELTPPPTPRPISTVARTAHR